MTKKQSIAFELIMIFFAIFLLLIWIIRIKKDWNKRDLGTTIINFAYLTIILVSGIRSALNLKSLLCK